MAREKTESRFARPNGVRPIQRFWLLTFGGVLVLLCIGFAISQGIGEPSVPAGDVALVEGVPEGKGEISKAELDEAIEEQEAYFGGENPPTPTPAQYKKLQDLALKVLLEAAWTRGEIGESGVSVSDEEVEEEINRYKRESFESEAAFRSYLKENDKTLDDLRDEAKSQMLLAAYEKQEEENTPVPSHELIKSYYEVDPEQFTEQEERRFWIIASKDRDEVDRARRALEGDSSAANWSRLAKQISEGQGVGYEYQSGLHHSSDGDLHQPLNDAVFSAPAHELQGPLSGGGVFSVFEVQGITPPKLRSLESAEKYIEEQLSETLKKEYSKERASEFIFGWLPRTTCAPGYVMPYCGNYETDPHPATANPACYEADPKGGLPKEGCPAPVTQAKPALPGSVTLLRPKGIPLAQRPHQVGADLEDETEEGSSITPTEG